MLIWTGQPQSIQALITSNVMLSNITVVFNCLHYDALDNFNDFKLLSDSQSHCSKTSIAYKLQNTVFKRTCDNLCLSYGASRDWSSLPNNETACFVFKSFMHNFNIFVTTFI